MTLTRVLVFVRTINYSLLSFSIFFCLWYGHRDETIGDVKTTGSEFSAVCGHNLLSHLHEARVGPGGICKGLARLLSVHYK